AHRRRRGRRLRGIRLVSDGTAPQALAQRRADGGAAARRHGARPAPLGEAGQARSRYARVGRTGALRGLAHVRPRRTGANALRGRFAADAMRQRRRRARLAGAVVPERQWQRAATDAAGGREHLPRGLSYAQGRRRHHGPQPGSARALAGPRSPGIRAGAPGPLAPGWERREAAPQGAVGTTPPACSLSPAQARLFRPAGGVVRAWADERLGRRPGGEREPLRLWVV